MVIPQAMRVIVPPLTSQYLNVIKNSSLAMAVGFPDLVAVFAGTTLNQTGQAIEIIAMTMAVYLAISLVTALAMNLYNRRLAAGGAVSDGPRHVRPQGASPALPPPVAAPASLGWLRTRLFAGLVSTVLTLVSLAVLWLIVPPLVTFLVLDAVWSGEGREACLAETPAGRSAPAGRSSAAKLGQLIYGFYPADERWRVDLVFAAGCGAAGAAADPAAPFKRLNAVLFFVAFPVAAYVLLVGGWFGLADVETRAWGGLLVTLVVAVTGIVAVAAARHPAGARAALRRCRWCAGCRSRFIEFWRGVPLITVLFFATYMLPLFLPGAWSIDKLLRALIGVAVFAARLHGRGGARRAAGRAARRNTRAADRARPRPLADAWRWWCCRRRCAWSSPASSTPSSACSRTPRW